MSNETRFAKTVRVNRQSAGRTTVDVEQTIYANEDNPLALVWTNAEVLELLGEIYERLALDDPEECAACDTPLAECPMPVAGCCSDCTHAANYSTPHPTDLESGA